MKLVDILARELEEWPEAAEVAKQSDITAQIYFYNRQSDDLRHLSFDPSTRRRAEDCNLAFVTRKQWQTARAAYLASIQPERDAEISEIVESALQIQQGGTHYKDMALQPWEAIDAWLTHEQHMGYLLGTALAYLARYNAEGVGKGGMQDVKKAAHTLQRMIEVSAKGAP